MLNLKLMFKVKRIMRIGEVSKIVGLSSSAIRFYERHGILNSSSISRSENGYRIYGKKDVEKILLIIKFKELGLELEEIKNLLSEESKSCGDLLSSLDAQLSKCRKIEKHIKERIGLLLSAKENCKIKCAPENDVKKCCG